jgi:hypothetical protein
MNKHKDFPFLPTLAFHSISAYTLSKSRRLLSLAMFIVIDIDVNRMATGLLGKLWKNVGEEV